MTDATDPERSTRPRTEMLELERPERLRLLAATDVGRVAISVTEWDHPVVRPVNYVFDEPSQSVLIRTGSGSTLHALLRSARAAFEIDGTEPGGRVGWSVIIVGVAEEIRSAAEVRRIERLGLDPWAPGYKGPLDPDSREPGLRPTDRPRHRPRLGPPSVAG
jgi:uncharacterized protein